MCATTSEEVEEDMETWRVAFERHGLNISSTKTEYLPIPANDTETTVKIGDAELPIVTSFKYIGSLVTIEGGSQADVSNMIKIVRMKWKEVSGVMCDRKMPVELKDKVLKTHQTSKNIRFRMLGRKEERREQTKLSRNEDVEMDKLEDQVGPHQK